MNSQLLKEPQRAEARLPVPCARWRWPEVVHGLLADHVPSTFGAQLGEDPGLLLLLRPPHIDLAPIYFIKCYIDAYSAWNVYILYICNIYIYN